VAINPQMLNPRPAIVSDVRFRRALLEAIDRQQLVDSFQGGLSSVGHSYVHPSAPEYPDVQASVVRYDYDPRSAQRRLEELGYASSSDGMLRDAEGQRLGIEIRTAGGTTDLATVSVADFWQRIGIAADPVIIPPQRRQDREYRGTFPSFELLQLSNELSTLSWQRSTEAPLPENGFAGRSKNRYMNPEYDGLIDRFYTTIPHAERMGVLAQIVHHMSDRLILWGVYYNTEPAMIGRWVQEIVPGGAGSTLAWNAFEWDLK
jgi:peptide/nickel transport system substrate-binding protein